MRRALALGIVLLALAGPARAQQSADRRTVPADATVERVVVRAPGAALTVVGHSEASVVAEASAPRDRAPLGSGLTAVRAGALVVVEIPPAPAGTRVTVRVPRGVALELHGSNGGAFVVVDVEGEIEVENSNAPIQLVDVTGPVVAATSNGAIEVRFSRVPPNRPMSFLTSNGPIEITLPDGARADLHLQTDTGTIRSDFPLERIDAAGPPPAAPAGPGAPRPGRIVHARLGGGGATWRLWTDNSALVFRRAP